MGGVGFAPPTVCSKNSRRSETYASHRNCHTETYGVVNFGDARSSEVIRRRRRTWFHHWSKGCTASIRTMQGRAALLTADVPFCTSTWSLRRLWAKRQSLLPGMRRRNRHGGKAHRPRGSVCLSAMSISLLMALLFVHFIAIFWSFV